MLCACARLVLCYAELVRGATCCTARGSNAAELAVHSIIMEKKLYTTSELAVG